MDSDEAFNKALSEADQGINKVPDQYILACKVILKLILTTKREDALDGLPAAHLSKVLSVLSRNFYSLLTKDKDFQFKLIPTFFKLASHSGKVEFADLAWNCLAQNSPISKLVS